MTDKRLTDSSSGFTIVELLIATAVLSTILVMVTIVMVGIGSLYYKGLNQSRIQDAVRSTTNEVAQHLQLSSGFTDDFGGGPPNPAIPHAYCIGNTRYTYIQGIQIGSASIYRHILWRDTLAVAGGTCAPVDLTLSQPSAGGTELISPHSRLTDFSITGSSQYQISIGMAYGDDNLLTPPPYDLNTKCLGGQGDQFCATASLSITVVQRLTGS